MSKFGSFLLGAVFGAAAGVAAASLISDDKLKEVKDKIKSGEIAVDNSSDDSTKPTVSEFTTVNYIQ